MSKSLSATLETAAPRAHASRWARPALALWAIIGFVIIGALAIAHDATLPRPPRAKPELVRALAARTTVAERGRYTVTHVLYAECTCSQRILDHLAQRGARRDVSESAILIDPGPELVQRLQAAHYRVETLTPLELQARYAIESAPLLIVADPAHQIRYLGGYTEHKQALDIRDDAIIDSVLAGRDEADLPLFGCAVSERLQKMLDPLGLKY